jgi:hypothetical protein
MTKSLLTYGNPKIVKGIAKGYLPVVLHLAPFKLAGLNVCPMAEVAGCVEGCLNTAGRGGIVKAGESTNAIQRARIAKTQWFASDRQGFMLALAEDIVKAQRKAAKAGLTLCVRLNGTSDIRWEQVRVEAWGGRTVFERFSDVQFYDYTKIPNRKVAHIPNYRVTFSYSGVEAYQPHVQRALEHYGDAVNVAAVFADELPAEFLGRRVIDGDETDLRFLDEPGVVVGLKAKGKAKRDTTGFVVRGVVRFA